VVVMPPWCEAISVEREAYLWRSARRRERGAPANGYGHGERPAAPAVQQA
jgi:hypothetical protein